MKKFQVFTPSKYVAQMLDEANYTDEKILKKFFLENSVGDGSVLCEAVRRYIELAVKKGFSKSSIKLDLERYFLAFEIDDLLITHCVQNLDHLALEYNIKDVQWNIKREDYLKSELENKVHYIVGNPPYITYQELGGENREYLKENFISCKTGKFDYCYAFIEKSLNDLIEEGVFVYLIPSSLFKNVFAKNLRDLMKKSLTKIIDYKHTDVFENVLTSSAIIVIDTSIKSSDISYYDIDNQKELIISKKNLRDRWYFEKESREDATVTFGDLFKVSNSVATLSNSVFLLPDGINIEEELIRPAASPRRLSKNIREVIIFPYKYDSDTLLRYSEEEFMDLFPQGVKYLLKNKVILDGRKSDGQWFEYGRSQALKFMNQKKLMISSVVTDRVNVYELDEQTIPYSGFYIIPIADEKLDFAKEILESEEFFNYIETRAINASGRSLRLSVNDIRNYPIRQ